MSDQEGEGPLQPRRNKNLGTFVGALCPSGLQCQMGIFVQAG